MLFVVAEPVASLVEEVVGDGGDDAGGAVGWGGDDAAAGGIFFVDGHGDEGDGVEWSERVAGFLLGIEAGETAREARGAAADVEAAGQGAFVGDAAVDAVLHGLPEGEDGGLDLLFGCEGFEHGRRRGEVGALRGDDAVDAARDGGVVEERDFVGEDDVGDGEAVFVGDAEELGGA